MAAGAYTVSLCYGWTGESLKKKTVSFDFPAATVMITVALTRVLNFEDEFEAAVGIKYVRERKPNGTVVQHDLGHGPDGWNKSYHGSNICGVTFAMGCEASLLDGIGTIFVW